MNNNFQSINRKYLIFSFIVSIIFVFIASYSTSPLYPNYYGHDSAQFQLLGKCWIQNIIPPLDIFDHKGPLIFFINAVGYFLTGNSFGVLIVQIVFLTFTIYIFCKFSWYYLSSYTASYIIILVTLFFLCSSYNDGNLTEEYCLPFISLSAYLQFKFLDNKSTQHSPLHSLVYGISFGVCLCTRVTNAIMICSGVFIIYILILYYKSYINFIKNISCFVLGILIISLPFVLYYHAHNGLYEAFYCAILANIEYKKHIVSWISNARPIDFFVYFDVFFPTYCLFLTSVFLYFRKKRALAYYCILTSFLELYLFLTGSLFRHYAMIALPQFIIFLCELFHIIKNNIKLNFSFNIFKFICASFVIALSVYNIIYFFTKSYEIHTKHHDNHYEYDRLLQLTNKNDPFIVYGGDPLVHFYIRNDIFPCYKYYILQEWQAMVMPKIAREIKTLYSSCRAKWILSDNNYKNIKDILDKNYTLVASTSNYKLWLRK